MNAKTCSACGTGTGGATGGRGGPARRGVRAACAPLAAAAVLFFAGCQTITDIGTSVGVATGKISESQAESIKKSSDAVARSFEDITPEQEYYLGRAVGANLVQAYDPWDDRKATEYVNLLGQSLAMVSDRPETFNGYHFLILDSEEINAFAAPSGFIFVTRGMLRCTSGEPTLAAVLAHEVAHVQHKHGLQAIKKSRITTALTSVALTSVELAGPGEIAELTRVFDDSIMDITTTLTDSGYSREFEREADHTAARILRRVGYHPGALVEMLQVMDERLDPEGPGFARTHPDPRDRIRDIQADPGGSGPRVEPTPVQEQRYRDALGNL
jgi:predicted Zn-dependent protease